MYVNDYGINFLLDCPAVNSYCHDMYPQCTNEKEVLALFCLIFASILIFKFIQKTCALTHFAILKYSNFIVEIVQDQVIVLDF